MALSSKVGAGLRVRVLATDTAREEMGPMATELHGQGSDLACSCLTAGGIVTCLTRTSARTKTEGSGGWFINEALGLLLSYQLLNGFLSTLNLMMYVLLCEAWDGTLQTTFCLSPQCQLASCYITLKEDHRGRLKIKKRGKTFLLLCFCFCQWLPLQF